MVGQGWHGAALEVCVGCGVGGEHQMHLLHLLLQCVETVLALSHSTLQRSSDLPAEKSDPTSKWAVEWGWLWCGYRTGLRNTHLIGEPDHFNGGLMYLNIESIISIINMQSPIEQSGAALPVISAAERIQSASWRLYSREKCAGFIPILGYQL